MHPDGRAAGDPLRDRLVCEDLALPAGDGAEQRDPVADLLAPVAAIALDLGVGEADERLDVGARDVVQHPAVELGVDPPGLGRTHPVRDPAGGEQRDALPRRPAGTGSGRAPPGLGGWWAPAGRRKRGGVLLWGSFGMGSFTNRTMSPGRAGGGRGWSSGKPPYSRSRRSGIDTSGRPVM